jgi:hypothetical protein
MRGFLLPQLTLNINSPGFRPTVLADPFRMTYAASAFFCKHSLPMDNDA